MVSQIVRGSGTSDWDVQEVLGLVCDEGGVSKESTEVGLSRVTGTCDIGEQIERERT